MFRITVSETIDGVFIQHFTEVHKECDALRFIKLYPNAKIEIEEDKGVG